MKFVASLGSHITAYEYSVEEEQSCVFMMSLMFANEKLYTDC